MKEQINELLFDIEQKARRRQRLSYRVGVLIGVYLVGVVVVSILLGGFAVVRALARLAFQ